MQVAYRTLLTEVQEASKVEKYNLLTDVRETSRPVSQKIQEENKKLFEASRIENQKLLADVQETVRAENCKLQATIMEKL